MWGRPPLPGDQHRRVFLFSFWILHDRLQAESSPWCTRPSAYSDVFTLSPLFPSPLPPLFRSPSSIVQAFWERPVRAQLVAGGRLYFPLTPSLGSSTSPPLNKRKIKKQKEHKTRRRRRVAVLSLPPLCAFFPILAAVLHYAKKATVLVLPSSLCCAVAASHAAQRALRLRLARCCLRVCLTIAPRPL